MSGGKLPEGWSETEIGDIADVISGGTPKSGIAENFALSGEGIAWLTPADLSGYKRKLISRGARDLSTEGYSSCSAKLMPAGAILFSSRAPIGYVAVASNEISTNQGFKSFVFTNDIYPDYAYYYLRNIRHLAEELGTGTTFKEISGSAAKTLPFVMAPLAEQKIIAEKLDTLLAQVDSTKARLEQIPQILKRFRQAVLEEAVSGRLTENWRDARINEESAEELLVNISKTRKKNLTSGTDSLATESKRYLAKIDAHHFNIPDIILPVGWKWTTFLQSMEKVVDCHNKTAPYTEEGIYLIRTPDIRNGIISLKNTKFVNEDTYNFWSKRCPPKSGDIIFTREAPMGEAGIVPENILLCMGQRMMLLRPLQSYLNNKYVLLNILSISFQARMMSQAIGTGVKHLRVADVESLMYPLPPLPEQHEIVRRVEQLFAYADTIEKQVNNALTRVNSLTQSILAKAFRGELTAQWRAENPDLISGENSAAALLEKIKAERAASGGKKTSRKKV